MLLSYSILRTADKGVKRMNNLEPENQRLPKVVPNLTLDKLVLRRPPIEDDQSWLELD
jgi:hypothetical protein